MLNRQTLQQALAVSNAAAMLNNVVTNFDAIVADAASKAVLLEAFPDAAAALAALNAKINPPKS